MLLDVDSELAARFSDALVSEIKAEMGRRDLSSRGLARLIGVTPQFVSSRLDGGNPRTGERVLLTVRDLSSFAQALGVTEVDLVDRARRIAAGSTNVVPGDFGVRGRAEDDRAVAKTKGRDRGGDDGEG